MGPPKVLPLAFAQWLSGDWMTRMLSTLGAERADVLADPTMRLSDIGSRIIHGTGYYPNEPSKAVTLKALGFMLDDLNIDPNLSDDYGRTALTLFVTGSSRHWVDDLPFGLDYLSLLFEYGADANVLFTPPYVGHAGCEQWTLAHQLDHRMHFPIDLPQPIKDLLDLHVNPWSLDSEGRRPAERWRTGRYKELSD